MKRMAQWYQGGRTGAKNRLGLGGLLWGLKERVCEEMGYTPK